MNNLLIHNADYENVNKIRGWNKANAPKKIYYQLSLFSRNTGGDDYKYLLSQIDKAVRIYNVLEIVLIDGDEDNKRVEDLINNKYPKLKLHKISF